MYLYKPNSLYISSSFYLDWKLSLSDTQKCEFEDKDNSNTQKKKKKVFLQDPAKSIPLIPEYTHNRHYLQYHYDRSQFI